MSRSQGKNFKYQQKCLATSNNNSIIDKPFHLVYRIFMPRSDKSAGRGEGVI